MVLKPRKEQTVVVAYPHPHEVSARFHKSLIGLFVKDALTTRRIVGHLANSSGANVTNARNEIVEAFLDNTDADWLCFIDADMVFETDVVERLVHAAHPELRPIVGALCFSLQNGTVACPTVYAMRDDGQVGRVFSYPRDSLVRCLTGTGCLLIHRDVLDAMRGRFAKPYQWFREDSIGEVPVGEDLTFCIRAESLGFAVHVDTSVKVGHEKPFVVDEAMFEAQQTAKRLERPAEPTFVVIPVKRGEREEMTARLVEQLGDYPIRLDDSEAGIHQKWNAGLDWAEAEAKSAGASSWNVAILNNDIVVEPGFLNQLARGLRLEDDFWISYPNVHGHQIAEGAVIPTRSDQLAGQTMSGWAFMVRGESGLRVDERFAWWYGDSDLQKTVESKGKHVVCVGSCFATHLDPMRSTMDDPKKLAVAREDEARFAEKWKLDPETLWLAQNAAMEKEKKRLRSHGTLTTVREFKVGA